MWQLHDTNMWISFSTHALFCTRRERITQRRVKWRENTFHQIQKQKLFLAANNQKLYSPPHFRLLRHYSWFAASLFVLISRVRAACCLACQLYCCQGKAWTNLCQRQPLPATAVPHMLPININKHGLPAPGKRIDRYDSSSVPLVGGRSNNKQRQIFSHCGATTGVGSGRSGRSFAPPRVTGRVPHITPHSFPED